MVFTTLSLTSSFGIGAISEIVFAVITLLIGLYSFKVYRLTNKENYRTFSLAFFFIAAAYLFKSFVNLLVFFEYIKPGAVATKLIGISTLFGYGVIVHIILMMFALLLLINLVLKIKNRYVFLLLLVLSFFPLILTWMHYSIFYALASLFLFILTLHFLKNYLKVKRKNAMLVFIAFGFILLSHLQKDYPT